MQIRAFPPHYQLVYINFDISSFSVISYVVICIKLHCNMTQIAVSSESSYRAICVKLQRHLMHVAIQFVLRCAEASIFSGLIYTPLDCC